MKRLLLVSTLAFIVALVGCGGGSDHIGGPPPTGGFSNANFSGTYSFIIV